METNGAENNVVALEVQSNPHAYVVVRHSANCKDRDKGSDWQRCRCRKSIFTYFPATSKTEKKSAKTRSWSEAQDLATAFNDQFDPDKVRIKRLEADVEAKQGTTVRMEEAIGRFLAKKTRRKAKALLQISRPCSAMWTRRRSQCNAPVVYLTGLTHSHLEPHSSPILRA